MRLKMPTSIALNNEEGESCITDIVTGGHSIQKVSKEEATANIKKYRHAAAVGRSDDNEIDNFYDNLAARDNN